MAVAHLYATGPHHPGGPHGLLTVGLLALTPDAQPQTWLLNPGRAFGQAVQTAAQISNRQAKAASTWAEQREEIQTACAAFDALLILDRAGQPGPERHWLEAVVLADQWPADTRPPVCVGLDELTAFWLPDQTLDDADDLLDALLRPDAAWSARLHFTESAPRLPFVLHTLRRAVRMVLGRVLKPQKLAEAGGGSSTFQPAYALLESLIEPLEYTRRLPSELRAQRLLRALARNPTCCDEPPAPDGQQALDLAPLPPPPAQATGIQPLMARQLLAQWLADWRARAPDTGTTGEGEIGIPLPPSGAELASVFKYLGQHRPGWKPRPAQEQYAAFVADALGGRGAYALEAGTGTGKTFGYLVPAVEYLRKTVGGRVIIATSTKNLQDQIVSGELPALLGPPGQRNPLYKNSIRAAVLKGKNCYVCADALARTYDEAFTSADWHDALAWLYLALRLRDTEGEIEGIAPQVAARLGPALWKLLRATTADKACRHEASDELPECTYPVHRRRAEAANLIITNHHKLALLPPKVRDNGGICIIDEADRFPDNFRGALSRRFDARELYEEGITALLGPGFDGSTAPKPGLLTRLQERLTPENTRASARAYAMTDGLTTLRDAEVAADPTASLDGELERHLLTVLAQADLWAQAAEATADTPLAEDAENERDALLAQAATLHTELRQWRAVRAILASTETAPAPLSALADALRDFGKALLGFPTDGGTAIPYPADSELRWQERFSTWEPRVGTRWHQLDRPLCFRLAALEARLRAVVALLAPIREQLLLALPPPDLDPEARHPPSDPDKQLRERAARAAGQLLEAAELARRMLAEFPSRPHIHTVQRDGGPNDPLAWRLTRQPYDLAPHLYALPDETGRTPTHLPAEPVVPLLDTFRSVVFTSATLFVDNELTYFRRLLDLPVPFAAEGRFKSPFQYEHAVVGALPHFLTPFNSGWPPLEKALWREEALTALLPLLLALDGRALVLFTSNEELRAAADWLGPRLAAHDIELLTQNGASQWEIRRFRRVEQSVLLGVDRMWTGVDFAGATCAHVVIWRAPFPTVGDPLIAHRKQYETPDLFWEGFYYPSTRLKLRQGFGRLIRRETDRGAFTLLDARLSTARKHHHLLAELEIPLTEYGSTESLCADFVPDVLKLLKLGDDFKRRGWSVAKLAGA